VRLVVLGFSQGAATAARWLALSAPLARREPRAARLVLWGADLPHDLDLHAARPWLSAVGLTLVVGDADPYATAERVAAMEARLREADVPYRLVRYPGGHRIEPDVLGALADG
jgi:predicted esterase